MFFSALTPKQKGPSWLLWMAIATVGVGIILRFSGLSERVYWIDEVATSIRVAGYSFQEVAQTLYQGQPLTPETILRFVSPAPDRSVGEMLHSLGIEDSQHPPLYYFLTFFWMRLVGHSPAAMRSFSAILSVVAIPLLFWLCWELFASLPIALTAIALNAVSFMPISYAHEARQYSLWIVILLLMQISLWRYGKTGSRGSLCGYVMASGMGLNTFPVTILVIFSHGLYLMLRDRAGFPQLFGTFCWERRSPY